ncbi:MAG: phosphoenolpyruvate--protein phosphotransferase [Halanaerobiaceae bacterium]
MIFVQGIAASPGIVIGKAYFIVDHELSIDDQQIASGEVKQEIERLYQALDKVKEELQEIKNYIARELGQEKARIFKAHIMLLNDPELLSAVEEKIKTKHIKAEKAVDEVIGHYVNLFISMQDEYLQGRKTDVRDVGDRIIKELIDQKDSSGKMEEEGIVVARDLTPADTAQLDRSVVKAFVTEQGSRTSHSAIMARSLGVPAVVGLGEELREKCHSGDTLIVDGTEGQVIVNPDPEVLEEYKNKAAHYEESQEDLLVYRDRKAQTKEGKRIEVVGNIGEPGDVDSVLDQGGEGIGLFRTEFLYMNRQELPTEEEQFEVYRDVAQKMGDKPVVIRTLDIGGGKNLPYFELEEEKNPFLGFRAIRISLEKKEIFIEQLKAILRASNFGNIKIMYPMISSLEELKAVKQLFARACRELENSGQEFNPDLETGIMIEIPSTLMIADELAAEVDFFSIGTNDLIQYILAVDRNNEKIAEMHTPYHPAVLRFIKQIVDRAHENDIWIGMCGEAAGDELLLPYLLGIGLDELSMSAISILKIKQLLSKWETKEAQQVAEKVVQMKTEKEIKTFLEQCKGDM